MPGDSLLFTLAVYSTHKQSVLAPMNMTPQQYGVFLLITVTCTGAGPATYTVSHQSVLITSTTQIFFPVCIHSNVDDFKGCWELSLDQNGHIYNYWRRNLVWTSQTSPVSIPGPVQPHFGQLSTDLMAIGEQKYGAIGVNPGSATPSRALGA